MARLWQQIMKSEQGQALPIVLILLVVGGLLIAPSLNYAATSLNAGRIVKENVRGIYAADAGVEYALWRLKNDSPPSSPYYLPEPVVNQMQQVKITTKDLGDYVLYYGELIEARQHYDWLTVDSEMVWDEEEEAYKYTITITWQPESGYPSIKLAEVGTRLPAGYSYQSGSADSFGGNLSTDEPVDTLDGAGAHMLNWILEAPRPDVSAGEPTATQTFYVTGTGEPEGDYAWVVAAEGDIRAVSEASGALYRITAAATLPPGEEEPIARIRADVLLYEGTGEINIISWQINPQEDD